jgi:DNA-binding transcriptional regulator YbjK
MGELKSMVQQSSALNKQYAELEKEFDLPLGDPSSVRDELIKAGKMKERLEVLSRERERYNATVKALKVDLKILHGGDVGAETSLQEHMRLLNEKWETNDSRLKQNDKLKSELEESIQLLEERAKEHDSMTTEHNDRVGRLERDLEDAQKGAVMMEHERENMKKAHHDRLSRLEKDLEEAQTVLVKMERDQFSLTSEISALREAEKKGEKK